MPMPAAALGVNESPSTTRLVAPTGRALPLAPRERGAPCRAVDLAAIAAPAHHHLLAAARALVHPACLWHRRSRQIPKARWTPGATDAILAAALGAHLGTQCGSATTERTCQ